MEKEIANTIHYIKTLPSGGEWNKKPEGTAHKVYRDDPITKLQGLGDGSKKKLAPHGISTIEHMLNLEEDAIIQLIQKEPSIQRKIRHWKQQAMTVCEMTPDGQPQERPKIIDYRKFPNPFEARYGDEWREKIKEHVQMKNFYDIRDLVLHMINECIRLDKPYFWHDALQQLTDKVTRTWMQATTIKFRGEDRPLYSFWFRPIKDLLRDQPNVSSHYYDRQPGNFPTANAWDNTLNKDIHESVDCHCIFTHDLPKEDPNKFSRASPKELDKAYQTLLHPETGVSPSPERIVQDFEKVFMHSLPKMIRDRGRVDDGKQHNGRRYQKKEEHSPDWGGLRKRELAFDDYSTMTVHPNAVQGMKVKVENSVGTYTFKEVGLEQPIVEVTDLLDPVDVDVEEAIEVIEVS